MPSRTSLYFAGRTLEKAYTPPGNLRKLAWTLRIGHFPTRSEISHALLTTANSRSEESKQTISTAIDNGILHQLSYSREIFQSTLFGFAIFDTQAADEAFRLFLTKGPIGVLDSTEFIRQLTRHNSERAVKAIQLSIQEDLLHLLEPQELSDLIWDVATSEFENTAKSIGLVFDHGALDTLKENGHLSHLLSNLARSGNRNAFLVVQDAFEFGAANCMTSDELQDVLIALIDARSFHSLNAAGMAMRHGAMDQLDDWNLEVLLFAAVQCPQPGVVGVLQSAIDEEALQRMESFAPGTAVKYMKQLCLTGTPDTFQAISYTFLHFPDVIDLFPQKALDALIRDLAKADTSEAYAAIDFALHAGAAERLSHDALSYVFELVSQSSDPSAQVATQTLVNKGVVGIVRPGNRPTGNRVQLSNPSVPDFPAGPDFNQN